jgi:hypothetical protein
MTTFSHVRSRCVIIHLAISLIFLSVMTGCAPQPDLSYESRPDQIILYADIQPIAGAPPPNTTCRYLFVPRLRIWGDGVVFLDISESGLTAPSLWSGTLTSEQIKDVLLSLQRLGFFDKDWQIDTYGPNPAGTWFQMGAHLKTQDVEHSSGVLKPSFYQDFIDTIKPSLTPFSIDNKPDARFDQLNIGTRDCSQTK